jgi:hypothetical protein
LVILLAGLPALSGFSVGHIPELVAASPPQEQLPQLIDITDSTGIKFDHGSSPEQKYMVESMSGGVALIDYDRDGWPDIAKTFTADWWLSGNGAPIETNSGSAIPSC